MSLVQRPDISGYEIELLESSVENIGKRKEFDNIAGCLIAFACIEAFRSGYGGFVCLVPKTVLKKHYQELYNMHPIGSNYLAVFDKAAYALIQKYL